MTGNENQKSDVMLIGGRSLAEWEQQWQLVPQGFLMPQPRLRHDVGIFAAKDGDQYMYIGKAANMRGGGLSGGLARAYVENASGDKGGGLAMLRARRDDLQAYIIRLPRSSENVEMMKLLGSAMLKTYKPIWNQSEGKIKEAREAFYRNC